MYRVMITGIGAVTPIGIGEQYCIGLKENIDGATAVEGFPVPRVARVQDLDVTKYGMTRKHERTLDRFAQFGVAATFIALEDAELLDNGIIPSSLQKRVSLHLGSALGGISTIESAANGKRDARVITKSMVNSALGYASILFGIRGTGVSNANGCAAALSSIRDGYNHVRGGSSQIAIAGGSEAPITPGTIAAFDSLKRGTSPILSPTGIARPFDRYRDGFVMSEGAGVIVLEQLESALERDASIYGEIVGADEVLEGHDFTGSHPDGDGLYRAIETALGSLPRDAIQSVNAHGTATRMNDRNETNVLKRIFGDHAYTLAISAVKSQIGHAQGASGCMELIASLLGMRHGFVPGLLELTNPDDECDLDYVVGTREMTVDYVLKTSIGFGGHNAAVVVQRYVK